MKLGSYTAGYHHIELYINKKDVGGTLWLTPGKGKLPKIEIGIDYKFFDQVMAVLLHEIQEYCLIKRQLRFRESQQLSNDHAQYLFSLNHCQFTEICVEVAEYIEEARKDLFNAWTNREKEQKMSYSLEDKCNTCKLESECTDHENIRGAIDTIHQIGYSKSHRGAGTVTIDCANHEEKDEG